MRVKFITLNLWHGFLINKAVKFLKRVKPDIILSQEVYDGRNFKLQDNFRSLTILKNKIGLSYTHFTPLFRIDVGGLIVPNGNLIMSAFPFLEKNQWYFNSSNEIFKFDGWLDRSDYRFVPKGFQYAKIQVKPNISLNVFNIHGPWDFNGRDSYARFKALDMLLKAIKGKQNIILAGDFNLFPNTIFARRLSEDLVNVFKGKVKSTFNLKRKEKKKGWKWANSVVDMVFVSPNIKVVKSAQPQVDISDHLPLVCEFEI